MTSIPSPPPTHSESEATGPFTAGRPPTMCTHIDRPAPVYHMTDAAGGITRAQFHSQGWTDDQLIQNGMMVSV